MISKVLPRIAAVRGGGRGHVGTSADVDDVVVVVGHVVDVDAGQTTEEGVTRRRRRRRGGVVETGHFITDFVHGQSLLRSLDEPKSASMTSE